jgi:hypothetical protein
MTSATTLLPAIPLNSVLYQRAVTNAIGATAASSNSLGYLSTNNSQLEVVGQLTGQDPTDYYNFTFQNSGAVRLNLIGIDGTAPARVQIYDGSGSRILADSQGTTAQQQAYAQLTSSTGLNLTNGKYIVKVTYGTGGDKTQPQNYAIQIGSGTTFSADYRTLASATTVQATLLAGGSLGYNSLTATASLLTQESNGTSVDIFGTLSQFPTDIFA